MRKTIKTKSGRVLILPTPAEDKAITAAAKSDPDAPVLTDREWKSLRPVLRRGRPPVESKRPTLNMRVDTDVLAALRASGKGWQTRVNRLLKKAVAAGRI